VRRAAVLALGLAWSCDDRAIEDPREAQLVNVMAQADEPIIRARPALSAGKYVKMAGGPYDFFRGTVPLYRSDMRSGATDFAVSRFSLDVPLVPSLGDPHPENFGILRAADGTPALEPNDFDASDRLPYLWDVRRLAAGIALSVLVSNAKDPAAKQAAVDAQTAIVTATMTSYRDAMATVAAGGPLPPRVVPGMGGAIVADLFKRSERDKNGRELDELTTLDGTTRRFKLGILDPEEPQSAQAPLPPYAMAALPRAIADWRESLILQPPIEELAVLDAVRVFGSGVASWPRLRVLVLLRGPTDDPKDDLIVELKESADPNIGGLVPPGVYADSLGERVVRAGRAQWARLDAEPRWGWTTWLGFPCQIRLETEGQKGVSVDRFEEDEGTPEALRDFGVVLGSLVARAHASKAKAIADVIARDRDGWVAEQTQAGRVYAALVMEDYRRFVHSLHRTDGLRLGIPFDPADAPPPDLASVFGRPPPVPALP
jgi:uncharacterized protein (DUF2252 family)